MAHFQIAVFHMNKAFQFVADLLILLPFIYTESLSVFGRQYWLKINLTGLEPAF